MWGSSFKGAIAVAVSAFALSAAQADVKIGVAGPITGANASFGAQLTQGVGQAAEDFNRSGGILGQKISSNPATTSPIRSRASRSPTNMSATASSSSLATSTPA